jgi:ABC-2 type transport system permease protein
MKPFVIAGNSMRRFLRDRTTVFFTIIFPVLIIFIVGNATSRFDDPTFPVGIIDEGSGTLGAELIRTIDRAPSIELDSFDDREALAKMVRRGGVAAGLVVPASYDEKLRSGRGVQVEFLVDLTRGFPAAVRSVVSEAISDQGARIQAASFATRRAGLAFDASLEQARRTEKVVSNVAVGVEAQTVGTADEQSYLPPGFNYQAPSNLILFVFITSLAGSALLIRSRQLRVTHRMLGTPTTARTILAGETASRFAIAGFQAVFIFLVGTFLFGVEWGPPLAAAAVIVLFVAVGTSIGMLFGTIFRTPEQAGSIGAPLGIAAGMLGGCMWPLEIVPEPMQQFGHIFPHAWAMDAWIELIGRGGGIGDIVTELAVLAGFVAVLFPLGAWRLRRAITA